MDFLANNQGCSIQELYRAVKKYMARMTMYSNLDGLKKEGLVIHEKNQYRRNSKLFLVTTNLLVSVPKEIDQFKNYYLTLVKKTVKKIKKIESEAGEKQDLLIGVIEIFHMFTSAYLFRSTIIWPGKIHDVNNLNRLNTSMLAKFTEIQAESYQILKPSLGILPILTLFDRAWSYTRLYKYTPIFKKFGIENEAKQAINKIDIGRLYGNPERGVLPS
jgi:hypothetical protein